MLVNLQFRQLLVSVSCVYGAELRSQRNRVLPIHTFSNDVPVKKKSVPSSRAAVSVYVLRNFVLNLGSHASSLSQKILGVSCKLSTVLCCLRIIAFLL